MKYGIETDDPELKRMTIQQRGEHAWAVIDECGFVLAKNEQWDYEPTPSNRTEEFIRNTRFETPEQALEFLDDWWREYKKK